MTCLLIGLLVVSCVPVPAAPDASATPMAVVSAPTSTAAAVTGIHLQADGSGDYSTLMEAVQSAAAGTTITLGPGTYRLAASLTISKSLHLVGAGMDQTELVTDAGDQVVRINSDEPFAAAGITFRHEGNAIAEVAVQRGEATLSRCRFVGTALCGIQVSIPGQATLEGNVCMGHESTGIIYEGGTGGLVRQNECSGNTIGIRIGARAQPTLEGNICTDNTMNGIVYFGTVGGVARQNTCTGNGSGIHVMGSSQPTLEGNICTGNKMAGIVYAGRAGGVARQNDCSQNTSFGITVGEKAQPTLEENICNDNTDKAFGIFYSDTAGGIARRNECARNYAGIAVAETANPTLENNDCHDNTKANIWDLRK
ncbi:MAG: right-handed parallel beta-helix repeat-containing protein [Chloroflexi bacterium]|nr:right-handed parallel beta-helix repeat-containing protein [Chloroflexota bacterium]MBU1747755.1 right-handed parallel beta-helix repeat-containing protein [Chloroflexota bacterium]